MSQNQMSTRNFFDNQSCHAPDDLFNSSDDKPCDNNDEYKQNSFIADEENVLSEDVPDDNGLRQRTILFASFGLYSTVFYM